MSDSKIDRFQGVELKKKGIKVLGFKAASFPDCEVSMLSGSKFVMFHGCLVLRLSGSKGVRL